MHAGLSELKLPTSLTAEKLRERCKTGQSILLDSHQTTNYSDEGEEWVGLTAKEQYCTTPEYYQGRHAPCRQGISAYYKTDLRMLYGTNSLEQLGM